jgi:hypothetical protein
LSIKHNIGEYLPTPFDENSAGKAYTAETAGGPALALDEEHLYFVNLPESVNCGSLYNSNWQQQVLATLLVQLYSSAVK